MQRKRISTTNQKEGTSTRMYKIYDRSLRKLIIDVSAMLISWLRGLKKRNLLILKYYFYISKIVTSHFLDFNMDISETVPFWGPQNSKMCSFCSKKTWSPLPKILFPKPLVPIWEGDFYSFASCIYLFFGILVVNFGINIWTFELLFITRH